VRTRSRRGHAPCSLEGVSNAGRVAWDFDYRPIVPPSGGDGACDVVVATSTHVSSAHAREVLGACFAEVAVDEILARSPLFWLRVRGPAAIDPARLAERIGALGAAVRYVAPARHGAQQWAPPFTVSRGDATASYAWVERPVTIGAERQDAGYWFLSGEGGGVAASREATGTGAGTRLAVIDDDAAGAEALELDAEILIDLAQAPRAQSHGVLMVGWAVGAARVHPPFRGVAPDASPRLYLVPKPGTDVISLPLAIVRAVTEGADVVVCATYIEGLWSAMLDDALAFAERLGRGGRGSVVVLPTGRETSSPEASVHASLTLSLGDPASDPRVLCVAPGARRGGWFFYRDRKKLARPFANRGPAVRFLAPGDDVASPLAGNGTRLTHAESSGASAIAAGVVLLVLANNPDLLLREVLALLEATVTDVAPDADPSWAPLADAHDALPSGRDPDGHNAKHGYGALHAARACLAAADPVAWGLVRVGEVAAASAYLAWRRAEPRGGAVYSERLGRWMVRALIADARASHAARALARHLRLLAGRPRRRAATPTGAVAKQVALLLRGFVEGTALGEAPRELRNELDLWLARLAQDPAIEDTWLGVADRVLAELHREPPDPAA